MAYTQAQATQYYQTLTPDQQAAVNAGGGPSVQWFTNAVNAGVPAAGKIAGGTALDNEWDQGTVMGGWENAAPYEEWAGKRKPTVAELRRASHEGKVSHGEDGYDRWSDRKLAAIIRDGWDIEKGYVVNKYGDKVDKPEDRGPNTPKGLDGYGNKIQGWAGGGGGAGGKGGEAAPAAPPKPVTYTEGDQALSLTGNPLVDNMLTMFNQAQAQRKMVESGGDVDRSQLGHFARGEDAQVGGGDDLSNLAGMLMGTGGNAFLWTAVDDDAFGGLKGQWKGEAAKQPKNKQPAPPSPASVANPNPPPVEETTQEVVDQTTQGNTGPKVPSYKIDQLENQFGGGAVGDYSSPFYDMINNSFGNNANR